VSTSSHWYSGCLHDPTDHDAVGELVEVVVVPLAGGAGSGGTLEDDDMANFGRSKPRCLIQINDIWLGLAIST